MNPNINLTERTNVLINEFEKLSQLEKHQKLKIVNHDNAPRNADINGRHFEFLSGRSRGLFARISHAFSNLKAQREGHPNELKPIKARVLELLVESQNLFNNDKLSDGNRAALSVALQKAKKGVEILERKNNNMQLAKEIDLILETNSEKINKSTYVTLSHDNRNTRIKIHNNTALIGKLIFASDIAHNKFIVLENKPVNDNEINSLEDIFKSEYLNEDETNYNLKKEISYILYRNPDISKEDLETKTNEIITKILYYSSQHPIAIEHEKIKNDFIKKENKNITPEKIEIQNGLCTWDLKLEKGKIILERHDIMDLKGEDLVNDGKNELVFQTIKSIDVKYSVDLTNNEKVTTSYKRISKRTRNAFEAKVARRNAEYAQQTGQVQVEEKK